MECSRIWTLWVRSTELADPADQEALCALAALEQGRTSQIKLPLSPQKIKYKCNTSVPCVSNHRRR